MRKISINSKEYKVKPLKRRHIKALSKKYGVGYYNFGITDEANDELIDKYFEFQKIPNNELDDMSIKDIHRLVEAVIAETWGDRREEKNSEPSGNSSQTEND